MIFQQFPGKLFVMGEYSAVESGNTSVIASISKFLKVEIDFSDALLVESAHGFLNKDLLYTKSKSMEYVRQAILIAQEYSKCDLPFKLKITSELDDKDKKYGFGSSGVVVVAVISSILSLYQVPFTKLELFKLAVIVQWRIGNLGSGGDIAASIYQGLIAYTRYDSEWFEKNAHNLEIVNQKWPMLEIRNLDSKSIHLVVGWTQEENSTSPFVAKYQELKQHQPLIFNDMDQKAQSIVREFIEGYKQGSMQTVFETIKMYREWMLKLQNILDISIETLSLKNLIDSANNLGYCAKISGAGGGDCGIVCNVWNDCENIEKLRETWMNHGILMLDIEVV